MFEINEYIRASKDYVKTRDEKEQKWRNKYWAEALKKADSYSSIALYGMGSHTKQFLEYLHLNRNTWDILNKIHCIINLDEGGSIWGIPVLSIEEAREKYRIDLIIISSKVYQEVIYARLMSYKMSGIELMKIYPENDPEPITETERSYAYYDEDHTLKSNIPFDHLQRYGWALGYVRDKVVVDMACGSGYGSGWMASVAEKVIGVDISEHAVEHARNSYGNSNCEFICEDIGEVKLPFGVDVVVSFETVEHIKDEEAYFSAITGMLKDRGILLISTPLAQKDGKSASNPFHINEYTRKRFRHSLEKHFSQIIWYRQDAKNDYAISIDDGNMISYNQHFIPYRKQIYVSEPIGLQYLYFIINIISRFLF